MKIIRNNYIPFQGYKAINLFGILFVRGNAKIDDVTMNHEAIHSAQIKEVMITFAPIALLIVIFCNFWIGLTLGIFSFYILYVIEWFIRLFMKGSAYRNISFEREAYSNEDNIIYIDSRKNFSWIKYLK